MTINGHVAEAILNRPELRYTADHAQLTEITEVFRLLPVPIIVALCADIIGVGFTIDLCSDLVVAAKLAKISDPHVKIGLVAGVLKARRYLLTGDAVPVEDAYQFGLVTDLVETPGDALPTALALAQNVAKLPQLAVQGTKRSISRMMCARVYEVLGFSFEMEGITSQSEDLIKAIAAFKEKREPVFNGC